MMKKSALITFLISCKVVENMQSCAQFLNGNMAHSNESYVVTLDLGLGDFLPSLEVFCEFSQEGEVVTSVRHSNEEMTKVDGFQERGSFHQIIHYHASLDQIKALVMRSKQCWQSLSYKCKESRLLDVHVEAGNSTFAPYGWWVSANGKMMDHWPGAKPGSQQCSCGAHKNCWDPLKACNCDSAHTEWLEDTGVITEKNELPVKELHFGDTGTPLDNREGIFLLGPLKCVQGETETVEWKKVGATTLKGESRSITISGTQQTCR